MSHKKCKLSTSGKVAPRITPLRNRDELLSIREAKSLVGYMSFHQSTSASISEVCCSSASVSGWSKYYTENMQKPLAKPEHRIFINPYTSPND